MKSKLLNKVKRDKQKIALVEHLNKSLGSEFNVNIVGDFDTKPDWDDKTSGKYIQINDLNGETYMDWCFKDKFDASVLVEYAKGVPNDQGKGSDDISKEYMELSNRILAALENYK